MHRLPTLFLLLLALLPPAARAEQVHWDAAPALTPKSAGSWLPKTTSNALPARNAADGVSLPVPARTESERLVWDTACTAVYQPGACLEFEFTVDHPAAIRQISVYFALGNGWRTASIPLLHRGWNRVVLPLSRFTVEGAPNTTQANLFRVALYPTGAGEASVRLHALRVITPDVLLVSARSPVMNSAERANSLRTVNLLHDWLSDAGVAHAIQTDLDLAGGPPAATRALVLAAVTKAHGDVLGAARAVIGRGGKVMVCGSRDAELAGLLQMELQTAHQTTAFGTYAAFSLTGSDGKPVVIHDHNWDIAPAKPHAGAGKVVALWQDATGRNRYEAALTAGNRGWWFSFPFHAGDQRRKQDLLVRCLGEASAVSLEDAARTRHHRAQRAGPLLGLAEVRHAAKSADPARRQALEMILTQAEQYETSARETLRRNLHAHAYAAAGRLEGRLDNAYAALQSPGPARELRGVWDHNGVGLHPGGWDDTCRILAEHGFNAVFPNLMWSGKAHFRSRNLPVSKTCEMFGDQLAACTSAAAKHGLEVHVWKVCWQLGGTDSPLHDPFKAKGRLQQGFSGEILPWLCPSQLENVNWEVSAISEVARHAGVRGIHLDYVRYPEGGGCFCPHTRAAFERYLDRPVANWPRDAGPGGRDAPAFVKFRSDEISRFVGRVYSTVKGINPKLKVSAAVFGKYPQCVDSVAQDWGRWLREGTVDFVTPMNYTQDPHQFGMYLDDQLALDGAEGRILPGIGAISTECELAPDEVIEQILAGRKRKLPGYVLFKLDQVLVDRTLPYLRLAQ